MYCYGDHLTSTVELAWSRCYDAMDRYGYLGGTIQEILDGIAYRTDAIEQENKQVEESIKAIENQLDILKQKYDEAVKAAKELAAANKAATDSANALADARNRAAAAGSGVSKPASSGSTSSGYQSPNGGPNINRVARYHSGTNYVKKANTWLNDMLGLKDNETAAILKEGEAVIPDYNNPSNPSSNFSYGKMAESISKSAGYAPVNNSDSASVTIGDIVIQGNATDDTVAQLNKVRKQIVDDVFKTINKHTNMSGYRNVKHAY